ncbi:MULTISPECIES: hypothetical protein [Deinococcus]|uniref:Lipoprotein n=1 Tax=Deinococcus piscis TaxID=394230 RepID=A0ABQ3KGM7_9DEIO|nr:MULTISPECIES: hypothetical protein [Deinococcus]MCY1704407.1 hypothetical protein [Deinococcus sp. SL84]GHG09840.1 hypothetical protein GCM10017783_22920 [Deinococcus piscis]
MKKVAVLGILGLLLSSCGSQNLPEVHDSGNGLTSTVESSLSDASGSAAVDSLETQQVGACKISPNRPYYGAGRIRADGGILCLGNKVSASVDALIHIVKVDNGIQRKIATTTVNYKTNLVSNLGPDKLKIDAPCSIGSYITKIEFFGNNATANPSINETPEYEISCSGGNQFVHPTYEVSQRLAAHSWQGHANGFSTRSIGIYSQSALQEYIHNSIKTRYSGRYLIKDKGVLNGKIALYDTVKKVIIIYNPGAFDRGTAFPVSEDYFNRFTGA